MASPADNLPVAQQAPWRGPCLAALVLALLGLLLAATPSAATPAPPETLVNHEARTCSKAIMRDDCSRCDPPPGWQVSDECPADYAPVERPDLVCRRYKNPFCCSGGAHRGDCEDMVLDDALDLCAFVAEIQGCALPGNWYARPADVEPLAWACPPGYAWQQEEVACLAGGQQAQLTPAPATASASEQEPGTWRTILIATVVFLVAAVLIGAAGLFPAWYVSRRNRS